ncbi:MAG: hypothetical protein ACRDPF_21960 [Streptosporangiaceae bacterium]
MPEALILEFTGVSEAEYAAVNKHLGIDVQTGQGDWPAGLVSHAAGQADDGTFIVSEVWSSQADQDAFMTSRLGAALAAGGVTAYPGSAGCRWWPSTSRAPEDSRLASLPR